MVNPGLNIWLGLFAVMGTLGFASSLYALVASVRSRRSPVLEGAAIIALGAAWWIGHVSAFGWLAMVVGVGLSALRLKGATAAATLETSGVEPSDHTQPDKMQTAETAPPPAPRAQVLEPSPSPSTSKQPSMPPQTYTTIALLGSSLKVSLEVLCASLRRGGERRAEVRAATQRGSPAHLMIGPIRLDVASNGQSLPRQTLEDAAAQSFEWPDALAVAGTHAAQVSFTTTVAGYERTGDTTRDAVLRAHLQAHAALAEFAPVIGVYYPASGLLIDAKNVSRLLAESDPLRLLSATGLGYRASSLEGEKAGCHCCGTVGLNDLGLMDIEIVTREEPDDDLTNALVRMVRRVYEAGEDAARVGDEVPGYDDSWTSGPAASFLQPDQQVMRFEAPEPEPPVEEAASS